MAANVQRIFARGTPLRAFCFVALAGWIVSALACWMFPSIRPAWEEEGYLIEDLQATCYALAFLVCVACAGRVWAGGYQLLHAIVLLLSLVACLDEISWGIDLFGVPRLRVMGRHIDAVHDVIGFTTRVVTDESLTTPIRLLLVGGAAAAGLAVGAAAWALRRRLLMLEDASAVPTRQFLIVMLVCCGIASLFDLHPFGLHGFVPLFIEEMLEATASISMILAASGIARIASIPAAVPGAAVLVKPSGETPTPITG